MNALKSVLSGVVNGVARSLSSAMYAGYRTAYSSRRLHLLENDGTRED